MIRSIAHPTDFSPRGVAAFEHALALAVIGRRGLDILHVAAPGQNEQWSEFPQVRQVLQRWGLLEPGAPTEAVYAETGVTVRKVGIHDRDPIEGMARYLNEHHADLVVMASSGRAGIERLFSGSVSAGLAQAAQVPTLILGPEAQPFVDSASGKIAFSRILVPVDHQPDPAEALDQLDDILANVTAPLDFVHVGPNPPVLRGGHNGPRHVRALEGAVVETLLTEARDASLIAMPMAGASGLADALRGSTTERVVRGVACPVLALPVAR
ncbi:MAG TPA: universal stress protein [Croceibacterium sp.]